MEPRGEREKPGDKETPPRIDETPNLVRFDDLARCGNEVWIRHGGQLYRLQQTRRGKLILTK